ncbi:hypothetical protein CLPU_1c00080 [Gottschalkia purinilytica]|uniref:Uncharacterized protein n=1 Tax=Gottschalkia purinilytica TaxID=1503 RepID=A0A0L0WED8_GOTPU|nr:hypothetical protein [Gottschalkia purinilytica]KNF09843.1 hypothetical protein CLPU_1c00080 [Gottschalkia purinilytica]
MKDNVYKLIGDITTLATIVSDKTEVDVFIRYSAHVHLLDVSIHPMGWNKGDERCAYHELYINKKGALDSLNNIKQHLIKILKRKKVDLTKIH